MFKLFTKATKPKRKVLTRAERSERVMQKLRAMKPGWPDAKLRAFAVSQLVTEPARQGQAKRAQYEAELAALVADGDKLLAQADANVAYTRALLEQPTVAVPLDDGSVEQMPVHAFRAMQGELAALAHEWTKPGDSELLAEANRIAREHGLPEL